MLKFENQQKIYYDIISVCSIASWYTILPWRMVPAWSRSSTSDNKPDLEEWCMDGQGHWFLTTSLILKNGAWMAKVINFWQQAWPWRMVPGWPRSLTSDNKPNTTDVSLCPDIHLQWWSFKIPTCTLGRDPCRIKFWRVQIKISRVLIEYS